MAKLSEETHVVKKASARVAKALRPDKRGDERSCSYIYADGTLAVKFDRKVSMGKGGKTVRISYWKVGMAVVDRILAKGRVVLQRGTALLLKDATEVRWSAPSLKNGSDSSRKKGIAVGFLTVTQGGFQNDITIYQMDDVLGTDIAIQEDAPKWLDTLHEASLDHSDDPVIAIYVPEPKK